MAKLTKIEKRAYDALLAAPGQTLGLDELVEKVYGSYKPALARSGMAAVMRMLAVKTESQDHKVIRTSPLGRGAKGIYAIVFEQVGTSRSQ